MANVDFEFQLTAEAIARGKPLNRKECAYAICLRVATGADPTVTFERILFRRQYGDMACKSIPTPSDIAADIYQIDSGHPELVIPGKRTIALPEEVLEWGRGR